MSNENPKNGDVFMLRDLEYSKKEGDKPDESIKTIKYDRPCILLNIQKEIAQVIPLTTHYDRHSYVYKLQIQNDRVSGALLSQITTVELSRLDTYIGKLKPTVFENIKESYFNYIGGKINKKRPMRTVARLFNHLDVCRFFSFHIYINKNTQQVFLCVKSLKDHLYFIPIIRYKCRNLELTTVCGYIDIDNMRMVTDKDYNEDYVEIGEEYRSSQRNIIQREIHNKKGMTIYTKLYIDTWSDVSWCVHELFGQIRYLDAMKTIDDIISNSELQKQFIAEPKTIFPKSKIDYKLTDIRMSLIENHIMNFIDPLNCDIIFLKRMKEKNEDLFKLLISPFKETIYMKFYTTRLFNGDHMYNKYKCENIKFIAEYVRSNSVLK